MDVAGFSELLYLVNIDTWAQSIVIPEEINKAYQLHPVHLAPSAADKRPAQSRYEPATGRFTIPARTALAWAVN